MKNDSIHELNLSVNAYNCLRTAGVWSIEDLKWLMDYKDLHDIRMLKDEDIEEINLKLQSYLSNQSE